MALYFNILSTFYLCEEHFFLFIRCWVNITFFTGAQFDIGSQVVGQKDMSKNVLDIWKEVMCTTLLNFVYFLATNSLRVLLYIYHVHSMLFFVVFPKKKNKKDGKKFS